ncbi:MAG: histidine ammonia-lyase [Planctomycetes bacterium]|nr:histidine ammonia-lyase [Planctomycetota bacterium]
MTTIPIHGRDLGLEAARRILADGAGARVRLALTEEARRRIREGRAVVDRVLEEGRTVYGVNTGFGRLCDVAIPPESLRELQRNLLRSHAAGVGPALDPGVTRLALALRIHALAGGLSGVRPELVQHLVALFNAGVIPVVPAQGSVGASGDLAPLAHMALVAVGEGEAIVGGERLDGGEALRRAGLAPFELAPKEGLALVNGTQVSLALALDAALRLREALVAADVALALSVEATRSSHRPFDGRIHAARPHPGQAASAANLRAILEGGTVARSHADCGRVQDAYSLRCAPQVHGASRDGLGFALGVLAVEVDSATDNPLVFAGEGELVSGGNFHGQPVALAADLVCIAAAGAGAVSERRVERLLNPDLSGLPAFLVRGGGLHSGLMMLQVTAAALVSENKTLSHPASVDSIPTSAAEADHVSMSAFAARKARQVVENLERVVAIELVAGTQALDLLRPLRGGAGVEAAHAAVRGLVAPLEGDRVLSPDVEAAAGLVRTGGLRTAVEGVVGSLS